MPENPLTPYAAGWRPKTGRRPAHRSVTWPLLLACLAWGTVWLLSPNAALSAVTWPPQESTVSHPSSSNSPPETGAELPGIDRPTTSDHPARAPFYEDVGQRPQWVQQGNYLDPENQTEYLLVASQPRLKQREAEEELEECLVATVRDHVDHMFTPGTGQSIGIDLAYIREHLLQHHPQCDAQGVYNQLLRWRVPEANQGMLNSETRQAFQCFSQVRLDPEFQRWAEHQWENRLVISRTQQIGLLGLLTLSVLTVVFGYFTAEQKTRGFYSRRLQTVSLACLAAMLLAFWWLASQFAWL